MSAETTQKTHGSVVARCVFCKEPLTRPGGQKWWIGGASHGEGLCYDCILGGMRVIMAGVTYAQEHGEGSNENPKLAPPISPQGVAALFTPPTFQPFKREKK